MGCPPQRRSTSCLGARMTITSVVSTVLFHRDPTRMVLHRPFVDVPSKCNQVEDYGEAPIAKRRTNRPADPGVHGCACGPQLRSAVGENRLACCLRPENGLNRCTSAVGVNEPVAETAATSSGDDRLDGRCRRVCLHLPCSQ